jgi:hypothetical protein
VFELIEEVLLDEEVGVFKAKKGKLDTFYLCETGHDAVVGEAGVVRNL